MAYELSFAGIPLLVDVQVEELQKRLDALSLDEANLMLRGHPTPGRSFGMTTLIDPPPKHRPKLNELFYPTGASRWSEFFGLIHKSHLETIEGFIFAGTTGTQRTLRMQSSDTHFIATPMYMLPPIPVAEIGPSNPTNDLFIIHLVDARYWLAWNNTGSIDIGLTNWAGIIAQICEKARLSVQVGRISTDYFSPEQDSEMAMVKAYENAAVAIDAVCWNTDLRFMRNLDGTYNAEDYIGTYVRWAGNVTAAINQGAPLAGGDTFSPAFATNNDRKSLILPSKFEMTFPMFNDTADDYASNRPNFMRHFLNGLTVWRDSILLDEVRIISLSSYGFEVRSPVGVPGVANVTKTFHNTAKARWKNAPYVGRPTNYADLHKLCTRYVGDWVRRQIGVGVGFDVTFAGIHPWNPTGAEDIIWTYSHQRGVTTRVIGHGFNMGVEELLHGTPKGSSSSSSSSSSGSSSSNSSSSSSSSKSSSSSNSSSSDSHSSDSSNPSEPSNSSNPSCSCDSETQSLQIITDVSFNSDTCELTFNHKTLCLPSDIRILDC